MVPGGTNASDAASSLAGVEPWGGNVVVVVSWPGMSGGNGRYWPMIGMRLPSESGLGTGTLMPALDNTCDTAR